MGKYAVLAEKPSVGRDIARVLGCHKKGNGYLEGNQYIVTWALGHLVTLADPETYDSKYQNWRLEDLPMLPSPMKLEVIKQTGKQYRSVKEVLTRKDVSEIIIATDAGREGELVARWILEKVKVKKSIKRLWISSVTDKAIKDGFNKLRDGRSYESLYASAQARSEADWYVGINATRALTCKFNAQLSCGRVQTPTLAMIHEREQQIRQFKPKKFYGITAKVKDFQLIYKDEKLGSNLYDEAYVDSIMSKLRGKSLTITQVDKSEKKQYAPGLFDLTELQREGNRLYGFSAKHTLNCLQRLYETHKVLTYPRTDSRYLSRDIVDTIPERLRACGIGDLSKLAFKLSKEPIRYNKSFVDDSKVSDHHAIIPTEQGVFPADLNQDERRLYDLVVKRFLAVLMPPCLFEQTQISAVSEGFIFKAKGNRMIDIGWKAAYSDSDEVETLVGHMLPKITKGDILPIDELMRTSGETAPPKRYTEGTLLTAMEKPFKNASYGIGTVATRADIIEKLLNTYLIEKQENNIMITSKGRQLLDIVPEVLKSPELTAKWEDKLEQIASGKLAKSAFINNIKQFTVDTVSDITGSDKQFKHDNLTREKCPDCGKYLLEVNGKRGKQYVCQDRECGYRRSISRMTNARCPNCHKKMELRGKGDAQIFVCKCGHREKLSAFTQRRQESSAKGNQKDVQKYLNDQKKNQAETVSPLAEALSKLKL